MVAMKSSAGVPRRTQHECSSSIAGDMDIAADHHHECGDTQSIEVLSSETGIVLDFGELGRIDLPGDMALRLLSNQALKDKVRRAQRA